MPEPLDFETIRWKTADQLSSDEADFLVKNVDKMNDEEKTAFGDLIQQATPLSEDPLTDAIAATTDAKEPVVPIDPATPAAAAPAAATPPAPELPDSVVTEDKLESYLEMKRKEWADEGKTKEQQAVEEKKVQQFFDNGYLPKDWNDYTNAMLEKIAPVMEQRILAVLDKRNAELETNKQKIQQTQQQVFANFEKEFTTLAEGKLIPDPKTQPEEYKKTHAAILAIGDKYGRSNVTDAYKLWASIAESEGGGFKTAGATAPTIDQQKQRAGAIGSARGSVAAPKKGPKPWHEVHVMSLEDQIEQRLQQP